jgi:hypothetical protein
MRNRREERDEEKTSYEHTPRRVVKGWEREREGGV